MKMCCLTINWFLLGIKTISSHTHKTGSWYLFGDLFKISNKLQQPFCMGIPLLGVFQNPM